MNVDVVINSREFHRGDLSEIVVGDWHRLLLNIEYFSNVFIRCDISFTFQRLGNLQSLMIYIQIVSGQVD